MPRNRKIAVIISDTLLYLGIESLLDNYFHDVEIFHYVAFHEYIKKQQNDIYDNYITDVTTFISNIDYFLPRKSKLLILGETANVGQNAINIISTKQETEQIVETIKRCFAAEESALTQAENSKNLSTRETSVLQQIVKGLTNKEIADRLNISLNTVLTHRKNITSKLGIKTVSGLTFYAIMNGIASSEDAGL